MTSSDRSGHDQTAASQQGMMQDQAIQWLLRQRAGDMSAEQWDAFTRWLEADARHPEIFDGLVETDLALEGMADDELIAVPVNEEPPVAANDNGFARFVPWAMAIAAALVLAIFVFSPGQAPSVAMLATAPGERQVVALSDEITMTLNGSSEVSVEEGTANVSIIRGEVAFAIDSTEPTPLRVEVADLVLTDYGTVFNVVLDDQRMRVAVGEGIVAINPDDDNIQIKSGELAEKSLTDDTIITRAIEPDTVATWRVGRLEFDDTPAVDAVAQLERSAGVTIELSEALNGSRLTGSILIPEDDEQAVQALAAFIGGSVQREEDIWRIE